MMNTKISLLIIVMLMILISLIFVFFWYDNDDISQENFWDGLSCEEMFDFAMSDEHQDLTMEEHMKFHKDYDPCIKNTRTD